MKQHAKFSPSSTGRWKNCPGSAVLSIGIPRKSSSYSLAGDAAHEVHEACMKTGADAWEATDDEEVAKSVQMSLDEIRSTKERVKVIVEHTERRFFHSDIEDWNGTLDHLAVYDDGVGLVAHVWDYKHGVGKVVDAYENQQALSYFSIIDSHYEYLGIYKYAFTVVQPRTFDEEKIKYWECGPERVQQHVNEVLDAMANTDRFLAGEWCSWCPALQICKVVNQHAIDIADTDFNKIRLDVAKLVELHRVGPAVEALLSKVPMSLLEAYRIKPIEGFKAVRTTTHRRWKSSEIGEQLRNLGVSDEVIFEPRKVRSPAKIEEEVSDEKEVLVQISKLWEKPEGSLKVVPNSARGKCVDLNDVSEFDIVSDSDFPI